MCSPRHRVSCGARGQRGRRPVASPISVAAAVPCPYDAHTLLAFLGARAIPASKRGMARRNRRTLNLPGGTGVVAFRSEPDHIACELRLESLADLQPRSSGAADCSTSTPDP